MGMGMGMGMHGHGQGQVHGRGRGRGRGHGRGHLMIHRQVSKYHRYSEKVPMILIGQRFEKSPILISNLCRHTHIKLRTEEYLFVK